MFERNIVVYTVGNHVLTLLKEMYGDNENLFFTVFGCSRIEQFVEMCTFLQESQLKC